MILVCPITGEEWEGTFPEELLEHAQNIPSPNTLKNHNKLIVMKHLHKIQESLRTLHTGVIE